MKKIKTFPNKELKFQLIDNQNKTIERLTRRTEESKKLTSKYTDKSFCGIINGNKFKIISSEIGKGAFCVMTGIIESEKGSVKVEIHKVFKVLLGLMFCLPLIAISKMILTGKEELNLIFILVVIGQMLLIRYVFIELAFKVLSKKSLNRLRDTLDIEWIKN